MIDFKNPNLKRALKIVGIIICVFIVNELFTLSCQLMTQPDTYLFYLGLLLNSIIGVITGYYLVHLALTVISGIVNHLKNSKDESGK
jgi:hypothetical protein